MRYGNPSIESGIRNLLGQADGKIKQINLVPLYPHFAMSTVATVDVEARRIVSKLNSDVTLEVLSPFYDHPRYIDALVASAADHTAGDFDHLLFSYHGLPERQLKAADPSGSRCLRQAGCCEAIEEANRNCYRAQCFATTRALVAELGLAPTHQATAFQSRLGHTPWIGPHTDLLLPELAAGGHRRLAVLCPAFVADCLETLEEIGIRARQRWRDLGGEELRLVPSLNTSPAWVEAVAQWVRTRA